MSQARYPVGVGDIIAGVSVAGLLVPESLAYAAIAGLPSGAALIGGVAGGLIYVLFGRSRFAIVSPTSSSAALLAAGLASLGVAAADRLAMTAMLVGMVGLFFAIFAMFRLGSFSSFVSRPVLRGFALGIALTIIIKQLPALIGVAVPAGGIGPTLVALAGFVPQFNPMSILLGGLSLVALLTFRLYPRLPGALLVLLAGIALASLVDLGALGIPSAGSVAVAWPAFSLPSVKVDKWAELAQLAAPLALILFAESWGTIRTMALRHGDFVAADRELAALGAANLASAVVGGMPVGAGFSVGSANESAGAQSRMAALTVASALLLLGLFADRWLARIPEPMLAAVVIAALTHALSPGPILRLFTINRDQWIALVAAIAVLVFGVLNGMLFAVVLSIASLLRNFSRPRISVLGRTGADGHDFVDLAYHPEATPVPGVAIYRPNAPLFFANADSCLEAIARSALADKARSIVLSLEHSSDLDSTAVEALAEFGSQMAKNGKKLVLARVHDMVRAVLHRSGYERLVQNSTFSVADAVDLANSGGD